jgi:hypothetical protein
VELPSADSVGLAESLSVVELEPVVASVVEVELELVVGVEVPSVVEVDAPAVVVADALSEPSPMVKTHAPEATERTARATILRDCIARTRFTRG